MLDIILNIAALIVTISILVTFHEYGHYYVARLCNVHVLRFSVGFGKPLWMRHGKAPAESTDTQENQAAKDKTDEAMPTRINGTKHPANTDMPIRTRSNEPLPATEFVVAAIPLGGYVKFLDERESFVPDDLKHLAFNRKSVWQRIAIVSAGPIANFLLAILAYWLLFTIGITGLAPVIGAVEKDSLADKAGLMAGQEIVSVNGEAISNWQEVQIKLFDYVGESGDIVVTARQARGQQGVQQGEHEEAEYRMPVQDWLSDADLPFPIKDLGIEIQRPQQAPVLGE
ncbi:MAG: site-2 protease family protein, partial [Pseudomonadales bacterium]